MKKPGTQLSLRLDVGSAQAPASWCEGTRISYLGSTLVLRLSTGQEAAVRVGHDLHLTLPPEPTQRQIRDCAEAWLRDQSRRLIDASLRRRTARLGLVMPRWSISFAAHVSWTQVDALGSLRFHWRLVEQPKSVIDQVVARAVESLARPVAENDLFAGLTA